MASPEVDKLIAQLSQILEKNRQQRQTADAMALGVQQGKQQATQERTPILQRSSDKSKLAQASQYDDTGYDRHQKPLPTDDSAGFEHDYQKAQFKDASTGYGHDAGASPYSRLNTGGVDVSAPSTNREGRLGLAQQYIAARGGGDSHEFLAGPAPDAGALEEQKKRFTQNLMLQRGEAGGPLGGAGAPPPLNTPTAAGVDPSVVNAVSGAGGAVPQINLSGPQSPAEAPAMPAPPSGWSADDLARLQALSQRYPG